MMSASLLWKAYIPLNNSLLPSKAVLGAWIYPILPFESLSTSDLCKRILGFPVIQKTPMEALAFIVELQQEINGQI